MSLPGHHPTTPIRPSSLDEAVERARHPRNRATTQLVPHREDLLRLRRAGESVETLMAALRSLGIEIGRETLRLWLARELDRRPARRKRRREAADTGAVIAATALPDANGNPSPQPVAQPPTVASTKPSWLHDGPRIARDDY